LNYGRINEGSFEQANMNLNDWLTIVYISAATILTIHQELPLIFNRIL